MKGRLSPGQLVFGVAGAAIGIWLGDYLFPDAATSMGGVVFIALEALGGGALGLIAYEVLRSFRSWWPWRF